MLDERTALASRIAVTAGIVSLSVLPLYLLGSLAPLMTPDMGITIATLGVVASSFSVGSALSSFPGGRFAERLGPGRVVVVAGMATGLSMLGFALLSGNLASAMALLFIAGLANGVSAPASDLALVNTVPRRSRGLAFGVKQTALPLAAFAAGIAVPAVGVTIGWRWAWVIAGVTALVAYPLAARSVSRPSSQLQDDVAGPSATGSARVSALHLTAITVAAAITMSVVTATSTYLVDSSIDVGFSASGGGLVLALASLAGITMRVLAGWRAGLRDGRHLLVIAMMMGAGAVGYLCMAIGHPVPFVLGAMLVFAGGWGWGGLMRYTLVTLNPGAPASATGVLGIGLAVGAASGPALFGVLVEATSYRLGWLCSALASTLGGILVLVTRGRLRARRQRSAEAAGTGAPVADRSEQVGDAR